MRNIDLARLSFVGFILGIGLICLFLGWMWSAPIFYLLTIAYCVCAIWAAWVTR